MTLIVGVGLAGAATWTRRWVQQQLPAANRLVAGIRAGELISRKGETIQAFAGRIVSRCLARRVAVTYQGRHLLDTNFKELQANCDPAHLESRLQRVGRQGDLLERLDELQQVRTTRLALAVPWHLPASPFINALLSAKRRLDRTALAARWDFDQSRATSHRTGLQVDLNATLARVRHSSGPVELVVRSLLPQATQERVASIDTTTVLSRYETRFGFIGSQAGRAKNVARAADALNGLVIFPGQTVSFNRLVGPRSIDNGFAQAGEIYKGEMRMGIGGGTCQAASTFHAAMYLSGMDVVERSPHSRPSGYIPIGLDATVAYPHVDLKLRNPYPFPIVIESKAQRGLAVVRVLGREKPAAITLRTATVGIKRYKRKIRRTRWLKEGRIIRKQAGRRGVTIEKTRSFRFADGRTREEVTRDVYPPTREIYLLGPEADEGSLPPLPGET